MKPPWKNMPMSSMSGAARGGRPEGHADERHERSRRVMPFMEAHPMGAVSWAAMLTPSRMRCRREPPEQGR